MLPPLKSPRQEKDVDSKAPLSQWEIQESFDSARECEDFPLKINGETKGTFREIEVDPKIRTTG
jgi:hypothetical protein